MSKEKTTKQTKKSVDITKYAMTGLTFLVGVASLIVLLGLAAKGLSTYLSELSDTQTTVASIVGVSIMAYAVASLTRLLKRK